jgi:hypothetical protein
LGKNGARVWREGTAAARYSGGCHRAIPAGSRGRVPSPRGRRRAHLSPTGDNKERERGIARGPEWIGEGDAWVNTSGTVGLRERIRLAVLLAKETAGC